MSREADIPYTPTLEELRKAREKFEANEPRDLFYRAATELVDRAIRGDSTLSLAEAIAVLLQTWNSAYYRFRPGRSRFDHRDYSELRQLLDSRRQEVLSFRDRAIDSYSSQDEQPVKTIFREFEIVLGPVGAAKALHLLAPRFFPLWDRDIAEKGNRIGLKRMGQNAENYCRLIRMSKQQWENLGAEQGVGRNPLKAVDEFNYCKYTREWL